MFNTIFKILWRKIQALSSLFTAWHQHMRGGYQSVRRLLLCLLIVYCLSGVAIAKEQPSEIAFNIPRQRADLSLISFAEQADITLLFPLDKMQGKQTNLLQGRYSLIDALMILLKDTGLKPEISESGQVSILIDPTFESNNDMAHYN